MTLDARALLLFMDYTTGRWERLRDRAFRRDKFRCRECLRYGKVRDAERAHHAWPAEEYPEYRWCLWNLVSLCRSCHDAMHERTTRKLTKLGLYWLRRTIPPSLDGEE